MEGFLNDVATYDDEELAEAEDDAASRSGRIQVELTDTTEQEIALLKRMEQWAARYETMPDAKAKELITYLEGVCRPDGEHWTNERVVVFTEYRDTQIWLKELLAQEGLSGERVKLLYGGMDTRQREQLRLAFQAPPDQNQVRILLATDAASEGIDLHEHCHRLVNYDIPFNPNKLEQRIGRIDRYGQPETPQVRHFIGKGWETSTNSYEADLEFLARVAAKVARMEEDLGTVNAVLADAVQKRMLGEIDDYDVENAAAPAERQRRRGTGRIAADANVSAQVARLRRDLDATVDELKITPAHVKRLVDTALELDHEQPLKPVLDERQLAEGLYEVPALTKSWARATEGLLEKLEREGEEPTARPITFDAGHRQGTARHRARSPRSSSGRHVGPPAARRGVERPDRTAPGDGRGQRRSGRRAHAGRRVLPVRRRRRRRHPVARGGALRRRLAARRRHVPPRRGPRRARPHPGPRAQPGHARGVRSSRTGSSRSGPRPGTPCSWPSSAAPTNASGPCRPSWPPARTTSAARSSPASSGSPPPCARPWPKARRRKAPCSAWPRVAAMTRRWPSFAATARNGRKDSAAWTPPAITNSSASAPATATSGGTASPSR